jgi:hypothetical protein
MRRRYVEKTKFICSFFVVLAGNLNRIAGVAKFQKIDAFDNSSFIHIQTGNNSFGQHQAHSNQRVMKPQRVE